MVSDGVTAIRDGSARESMMNLNTRSLISVGILATVAASAIAGPEAYVPNYGSMFQSRSFTNPAPLGLGAIQSIPKTGYDFAGTTKVLKSLATKSTDGVHVISKVNNTVLVLYDSTGTYGWMGDLYSQQMANLLNHFGVTIQRMPVENYQAGMMNNAKATFYLGLLYNNPLPAAFKADSMTTTQPLCWMGYNIWQIAWNADNSWNQAFMAKYGMTFYYIDQLGYPTVSYKGQNLTKLQFDTTEGRMEILDATKATRLATSTRTDGLNIGYITKGANLFYVADNPFSYTTYTTQNDRVLAFEDSIHEVLQTNAATDHRAFLRIEDVSPMVPAATLRAIADACFAQNIPFVVCVIPSFRDPLGSETGTPQSYDMTARPAFINALKYMRTKGGQIIMHGQTHQYSNLMNPYNGESADDFEFFRVITTSTGAQQYVGTIPEDSSTWAAGRLTAGLNLLTASGFAGTKGWVTPHYMASPTDYVEFQKKFQYSLCRGLTFTQNASGALQYIQQHSPWAYTDQFNMKRLPETVGYIDTDAYANIPPRLPADLVADAACNSVVRDGWAGMYFHWYLDPALLTQCITGLKNLGYRFVMPDASIK